jgi:hypothetical protein
MINPPSLSVRVLIGLREMKPLPRSFSLKHRLRLLRIPLIIVVTKNVCELDHAVGDRQALLVFRVPLAELQRAAGRVDINFTTPADSSLAYGGHISQNTVTRFWAGHVNTSRMLVFNWYQRAVLVAQHRHRQLDEH